MFIVAMLLLSLWPIGILLWVTFMGRQAHKLFAHAFVVPMNDTALHQRIMGWIDMMNADLDFCFAHALPWHWRKCYRLYNTATLKQLGLIEQTVRQS